MEKIEVTAKIIYIAVYDVQYGWQTQSKRKYRMKAEDGVTYWWDTTSWLEKDLQNGATDGSNWYYAKQDDVVRISGSVKKRYEWKGEPQVDLQRVKLLEVVEKALTPEERDARRKADQIASLKEGDFIWEMPYRQYKKHYADCETLAGSYREPRNNDIYDPATICVIIRSGRLKPSGTRGGHYSGYVMENELGEKMVFRAISEETAEKAARRESPGHDWACMKIYDYSRGWE